MIDPIELLNNVSDDGHIYTLKTEYKDEQVYRDENSLSAEYGAWNLTYRADVLAGAQVPLFVSVEALDETLYAVQRQGIQWGLQAIYYRDPGSISALTKYMGCPTEHYWDADQKKITAFYTDSAWLEYYKLMNRWYRDGILPKDYPDLQASQIYDYNNSCDIFVKDCGGGAGNEQQCKSA